MKYEEEPLHFHPSVPTSFLVLTGQRCSLQIFSISEKKRIKFLRLSTVLILAAFTFVLFMNM